MSRRIVRRRKSDDDHRYRNSGIIENGFHHIYSSAWIIRLSRVDLGNYLIVGFLIELFKLRFALGSCHVAQFIERQYIRLVIYLIHYLRLAHGLELLVFAVELLYLMFKSFRTDLLQLVQYLFRRHSEVESREISVSSVRNRHVVYFLHISHVSPGRRR